MSIKYLNQAAIKAFFKGRGRRVSKTFLHTVDCFLQEKFNLAAEVKNGGKKTVDEEVGIYVGFRLKG